MKLHQLKNTETRKPRKRVGRGDGSGRGHTCGRGNKGQGQRSGAVRRPFFEGGQIPLYRRLPKRGFKNPNRVTYSVVNVRFLEKNFEDGADVDLMTLRQAGGIGRNDENVKILGDGELTKALTVTANRFSAGAKEKITAAGGECHLVQ